MSDKKMDEKLQEICRKICPNYIPDSTGFPAVSSIIRGMEDHKKQTGTVELTPEMIKAGAEVMADAVSDVYRQNYYEMPLSAPLLQECVVQVFSAMMGVSGRKLSDES